MRWPKRAKGPRLLYTGPDIELLWPLPLNILSLQSYLPSLQPQDSTSNQHLLGAQQLPAPLRALLSPESYKPSTVEAGQAEWPILLMNKLRARPGTSRRVGARA